jgi:effector-binding domain-containing protein
MTVSPKKVLLITFIVALTGFALFVFFAPQRVDKKVSIPYSLLKIADMLSSTKNIVKWYHPFAITDTAAVNTSSLKKAYSGKEYVEISEQSMIGVSLIAGNEELKKFFLFTIIPDSVNKLLCDVQLSYNSTLFQKWFNKGLLEEQAEKSLDNLKSYMEDNKRLYGFEIERDVVTDTSFLFLRRTVPLSQRQVATKSLFEELISYAQVKGAGYTGTRIYYTQKNDTANITIFASIGISKRLENKIGNVIEYKGMPAGKNLLVATYQGPFADTYKVYTALEQYKADHYFTSMAIPFQKFMNDGYDFADEQVVQLKVYYPIF